MPAPQSSQHDRASLVTTLLWEMTIYHKISVGDYRKIVMKGARGKLCNSGWSRQWPLDIMSLLEVGLDLHWVRRENIQISYSTKLSSFSSSSCLSCGGSLREISCFLRKAWFPSTPGQSTVTWSGWTGDLQRWEHGAPYASGAQQRARAYHHFWMASFFACFSTPKTKKASQPEGTAVCSWEIKSNWGESAYMEVRRGWSLTWKFLIPD